MNTIRGFMGVAIESDATRFSGDEFAHEHWGAVRGAVRRRRAVRSAGVGSASVVGAGALVMGVAVVPWGEFSPLAPGSSACVTPTSSSSGTSWEFEAEQWAVDVADTGTADEWAVWSNDGGVIASAFVNDDGTVRVTEEGGAELVALPDTDGRYVAALTAGGYVVVERPESDGVYVTVSPTAQVLLEQGFAPSVVEALGGRDASYSRVFDCVTPSPSASASSTPAPGPSSSPSAVPTPEPGVSFVYSGGESPFQCGYVFTSDEYSDDDLTVDAWITTESEVRAVFDSWYGNQAPTTEVPESQRRAYRAVLDMSHVTLSLTTLDPASDQSLRASKGYSIPTIGFTFVGVRDGVVVGTIVPSDSGQTPGLVVDRAGDDAPIETFLWDVEAFSACGASGVDGAEIYAVAGISHVVDGDILQGGYAWKKVVE